jgi:hypothetical protein
MMSKEKRKLHAEMRGCFEIYERHVTTASASPSSLTAAVQISSIAPLCDQNGATTRVESSKPPSPFFFFFFLVVTHNFFLFSYGADNPLARHPTAAFTTGPTHQYHLLSSLLFRSVLLTYDPLFFKKRKNKHWEYFSFFF